MISTFYMGGTITAVTSSTSWTTATISMSVQDWEGVYLGTGTAIGDILWIDATNVQSGMYVEYKITSITSKTASTIQVVAAFVSTNHAAVDLTDTVGSKAIVARPNGNRGLVPVPAADVQKLPPKLCMSLITRNQNLVELDKKITVSATQPTNTNDVWLQQA